MLNNVNGMALLLITVLSSVVACYIISFFYPSRKRRRVNEEKNQIVLQAIHLNNHGIPIDEVVENLSDLDMSGFHLSSSEI